MMRSASLLSLLDFVKNGFVCLGRMMECSFALEEVLVGESDHGGHAKGLRSEVDDDSVPQQTEESLIPHPRRACRSSVIGVEA